MSSPQSIRLGDVDLATVEAADSQSTPDACKTWSLKDQLSQKGLWVFIIVAIVVLVVVMYIAGGKDGNAWFKSLDMPEWGKNTTVWAVIMGIGVLLFAWAAFSAYTTVKDQNKRNMILAGFGLSMLALIALFAVFYRKDSNGDYNYTGFKVSGWIAVFAAILGFAMLWPMWECRTACGAMVPYLIWISAMAYLVMTISKKNSV